MRFGPFKTERPLPALSAVAPFSMMVPVFGLRACAAESVLDIGVPEAIGKKQH
ncbi:hypothetical protein [Granulosicoccus antarcticus]|uniref:hypothetical protein n=1 Tax=Granulosicoccus antarcticus TaxID=437505 RepID=UPI0012FE729A|nr:hypothetical protein [Granulosicoccus antarcticus]